MPKYKTGSTPPHTHTNTRKGTLNTKTTLKNNHSRKSPRQRKTTKKHYKMPLTTIANSNQTSKSSEAFGTGQNPEINLLTCKEKGTTQIGRDAIENLVVPSFPKNPSTQRNQRVEALFNFLVERAASLKPPIKEICRVWLRTYVRKSKTTEQQVPKLSRKNAGT